MRLHSPSYRQRLQQQPAIRVIDKYRLPPVPAAEHVIYRSRILNAHIPWPVHIFAAKFPA
jgi:hypothetical protein